MEEKTKLKPAIKNRRNRSLDEIKILLNQKGVGKELILNLIDEVLGNSEIYDQLVSWSLEDTAPLNVKSAWTVSHLSKRDPKILTERFDKVLMHLEQINGDNIVRELLRSFRDLPQSSMDDGRLIDICFRLMSQGHRDVAVKYYSMQILEKLLSLYPELMEEFLESLAIQMEQDRSSFAKHAKRIHKKWMLKKQKAMDKRP